MRSAVDITTGASGLPFKRELVLWSSAALVVLAVHAGGGWYLARTLDVQQEPAAVEEAMMVDLTPMLETTPEAVESETLSEEEPTEMAAAEEPVEATAPDAQEVVQPEDQAPVVEETTPEELVAEDATPVEPEPAERETVEPEPVEPDVVTQEAVEEPTVALPDTDIPMPVSRPEPPREPVRERPVRRQPAREPVREQPRREKPRQPQRRATQEARPQPRSQASTQQRASSAPRVSPARWNSQVARLVQRSAQRAIRRIRGTGTVLISFSVGSSGGVSNVRVAQSSGNPDIDAAVVQAIRGISAPPPPNGSQNVTIPVLKNR
ncbi:energy transducer TonB [Tianweitania sp. BSSL-BM11]|uniref:Energy transducer TonB n=1 Tax=Tianweitania aestuarii TaxID=2814886 RepID=A0ABS5S039_9HYPH|nr:energy transducer TonB [Tianweitania aestuarii]MBS9721907.1 energy transducer TonB [Tianweitania aestuarii]